jgi:hypothetical protein
VNVDGDEDGGDAVAGYEHDYVTDLAVIAAAI